MNELKMRVDKVITDLVSDLRLCHNDFEKILLMCGEDVVEKLGDCVEWDFIPESSVGEIGGIRLNYGYGKYKYTEDPSIKVEVIMNKSITFNTLNICPILKETKKLNDGDVRINVKFPVEGE